VRVLLTNYCLSYFSGSELVTLELYEYFSEQGHDVEIFTNIVSRKMEIHLLENNVKFFTPDSFVVSMEYDLVWVHQQTIPLVFFEKNPKVGRWIFHHMSPNEPLEFTLDAEIENTLSEYVLANSVETALKLKKLGIDESKVSVLGNPAPEIFFKFPAEKKSNSYYLFISNHPPLEILEAMKILIQKGENIVHIGMGSQWAVSRIVTPDDVACASVVISIGKSIQYSIAMKKNFFIYDRFGGDGFIYSEENFMDNYMYNFSGRNSRNSKSAKEIVSELLNFEMRNPHSRDYIDSDHYQMFNLNGRMEGLLGGIDFSQKTFFLDKVNVQQFEVFRGTIENIGRLIVRASNAEAEKAKIVAEYNAMLNSVSWQLFCKFRRVAQIFTKK